LAAWREKQRVKHAYDVTADIYDKRYQEEQSRKYRASLAHLSVVDAVVLDVGCGSGLFFDAVANQAQLVVGIDLSHKLLRKAHKRAKGFDRVFVIQADADHLPFTDATFDAEFALTILQNMPHPALTLTELKRTLRDSRKLAVTGLKKAFKLEIFMDLMENSGMQLEAFVDNQTINCYIAILTT